MYQRQDVSIPMCSNCRRGPMTATCGDNDSDDVNPALHHDRLLDHDNGLAGCAPSWLSFSALFGKEVHHTLDIFPSASKAFGRTAGMASIVSSCALRLLPRLYAWYLHHDGFADFARSWSSFSALFGKAVHQKLNISPAASNAFGYAAGVASIVSSSILRLLLGQDARPLHHDDLTDFAYSWLLFFALLGKVVRRTLNILPGALNAHECAYDMASIASFCVYQMLPCLDIWYLCHEGFTGLADNARSSSSCFTLLGKLFHHTLIFFFETLNMHELAKGIASVISSCGFQLASFVFHRRTLTVHLHPFNERPVYQQGDDKQSSTTSGTEALFNWFTPEQYQEAERSASPSPTKALPDWATPVQYQEAEQSASASPTKTLSDWATSEQCQETECAASTSGTEALSDWATPDLIERMGEDEVWKIRWEYIPEVHVNDQRSQFRHTLCCVSHYYALWKSTYVADVKNTRDQGHGHGNRLAGILEYGAGLDDVGPELRGGLGGDDAGRDVDDAGKDSAGSKSYQGDDGNECGKVVKMNQQHDGSLNERH
ncbi:hypothetical protein PTNB29_03916 [Pyrenophora teres f. teres]|nr:hypothetical protein PTNB29_03916 [Pyrenophora teres f. teres]